MNSLDKTCNDLKASYDTCFNTWFTDKYLKGIVDDSECAELFKSYQQCVKVIFLTILSYFKRGCKVCGSSEGPSWKYGSLQGIKRQI